jgi:F0F1-type ATP synthase delta subunit
MAAAWLKQSGRERQVNYLVKDVVYELAKGDYVFAKVTTARDVSAATKSEVESYIVKQTGAKTVECQFSIDPSLIGGAVIETPHGVIDDSVKSKLLQIVEGVS